MRNKMQLIDALISCIENSAQKCGGYIAPDVLEDLGDYPDFPTARAFLLYKKMAKKIEVVA